MVLGIDPGTRVTGFAVIKSREDSPFLVTSGIIKCRGKTFTDAIRSLLSQLETIYRRYKPDVVVIEASYIGPNRRTSIVCARTIGAIISLFARKERCQIYEFPPRKVRSLLMGYGGASKEDVAIMISSLLNLENIPSHDATDACACALAYIQYKWVRNLSS